MGSDYDSEATLPLSDAEESSALDLSRGSAALGDETSLSGNWILSDGDGTLLSSEIDLSSPISKYLSDSEATSPMSDIDMSSPLSFSSPARLSPPTSPTVSPLKDLNKERQVRESSASGGLLKMNISKTSAESPIVLSDDFDNTGMLPTAPVRNALFFDLTVDTDHRKARSPSPSELGQVTRQDPAGPGYPSRDQGQAVVETFDLTKEAEDPGTSTTVDDDVAQVISIFEEADPASVRAKLQRHVGSADRIQLVINELLEETRLVAEGDRSDVDRSSTNDEIDRMRRQDVALSPAAAAKTSSPSPPPPSLVKEDSVMRDVMALAAIFPDTSTNKIFHLMESRSKAPNRMQLVSDALLSGDTEQSQASAANNPGSSSQDDDVAGSSFSLHQDLSALCSLLPDADPNFLFSCLEESAQNPERVLAIGNKLLETRNYPKLKDLEDKERLIALRHQYTNMEFDLNKFLDTCEDPSSEFLDESRPVTPSYSQHALVQLQNYFPLLQLTFIRSFLDKHKGHFTPALRHLEEEQEAALGRHSRRQKRRAKGRYLRQPRQPQPFPAEPDPVFFRELMYSQHEEEITEAIEARQAAKQQRLNEARQRGDLLECLCCYDDELLFEDMVACPDGHLFCKECVRRQAAVIVGEQKTQFSCFASDCTSDFSPSELRRVLNPALLRKFLELMQLEELRKADIPDLVSCPFCSYASIMPNPDDKVFQCKNSDCLKESCRLCREINHIPLRCDEVEKSDETRMRTFIENSMTEAMLRTCWKCKKKFFKEEGCNKMTCTCGASMCYVCRKPIKDYNHFGAGKCPMMSNVFQLHEKEVTDGGKTAAKEYRDKNPEAANLELKHDPLKEVANFHRKRKRAGGAALYRRYGWHQIRNFAQMLHQQAYVPDEDSDEGDDEEEGEEEQDDGGVEHPAFAIEENVLLNWLLM